MLKIGLTGGIASGKSTVCQLFSKHEVPIIDADVIARELVEVGQTALEEIVSQFGTAFLYEDGSLNRRKLRSRIFSDKKAKQILEAILHPRIRQQLQYQTSQLSSDYCILAIPLLIECGWQHDVDRILLIDTELETQIERLHQRDALSAEQAMAIIQSQSPRQVRLKYADDVIINNCSLSSLQQQVNHLDEEYRKLAQFTHSGCQRGDCRRQ